MRVFNNTHFRCAAACAVLSLAIGVLCGTTRAAESAASDAASVPGLAIGSKAPEFVLSDQNGKQRTLSQLLKQGNVALVFHRSADW